MRQRTGCTRMVGDVKLVNQYGLTKRLELAPVANSYVVHTVGAGTLQHGLDYMTEVIKIT